MDKNNTSNLKNIVYCDGGLCNRLNEILFVLILREKFGGTWEVIWPQTNWCGASFEQLFSIDISILKDIPDYFNPHQYKFIVHENYGGFSESRITFHSQLNSYDEYGLLLAGQEPIYYAHSTIPSFATISDLALALRHLKVNNVIVSKSLNFCAQHQINEQVIGLHIRKTDFGNKVNENDLYQLVERSINNRFFVCSDDPKTNYLFSKLPNCIVFDKTSFPEKLIVDLDWNTVLISNEQVIKHNLNRSEESIIEALIDLLILSKTTIIETSGSTFLRMALYFQATKYLDTQRLNYK